MVERTPNSLMFSLPGNLLENKPCPDQNLIDIVKVNLPIGFDVSRVYGVGDWARGRSSGGSVVLGDEGKFVAKVPLGTISRDPMEWALKMKDCIFHFSDVSPKTMVIIASDGSGQAKPIIIQEVVHGKPLCDSGLKDLFKVRTLLGVKRVLGEMKSWFFENNSYDLCGQKVQNTFVGRAMQYIPFFSDNIMLDHNGNVFLVDNSMSRKTKQDSVERSIKNVARKVTFMFQSALMSGLINTKRVYNFTKRIGNEKITKLDEPNLSSNY